MPSDRQRILKIVAVATVLILSISALVLGWLYLEAIENEKDRLDYLAIMHAHDLEAMSKMSSKLDGKTVSQKFLSDRIQELFNSQKDLHHFGQTGEVILVRRQEDTVGGFSVLSSGHAVSRPMLLPGNSTTQFQLKFSGNKRREILPDGRGNVVLAAYEPFLELPLMGVVAIVNIQEIQFPYLLAGGGIWLLEIGSMVLTGLIIIRNKNFTGQALPQGEAKLSAVIAYAGEGIVTFDEYGMIETFNEAAESMFSWQASEVIGMPFRRLFISSEQDACDHFLLTYRPSGVKRISGSLKEFNAQTKDGTVFPLTLTLTEAPTGGHRLFTALLRNVTEQKLAEGRLAAQYAVARVLADCTTIQQATPEILRVVCESLGWQLGVLWQVEPGTRLLRCVEVWKASPDRYSEFVSVTQGMSFSRGVGLPGRIWETGKPIWIPDAVKDPNFPRAPMADQAGLHAAFAFPIKLGEATHGVMEFFSREIQEPDEALLHQMLSVGSQIGQFMQRKETETALRESEEQTRLILDTALDAVVTLDENGHIIGWNTQAERMFGWTR